MKTEPEVFSIDDLIRDKKTLWEGVRNYQARNFMMNDMKEGDEVLFYHSSSEPTGIAGLAVVSKEKQPDPTQFNKKSEYYDHKATNEKPIWFCVEVSFIKKFSKVFELGQIKKQPELGEMLVLKKGQRLSIQPVELRHFEWLRKHLS